MSNKTEVLSFDEWYRGAKKLNNDGFSAKDFYEAGQQSRQAEVDELKRELKFKDASIKNLKLQIENKQIDCDISDRKMDELQNKYDAMYRAFTVADDCRKEWHRCYVGIRQREDELQKRIESAMELLEYNEYVDSALQALEILKGEETK